MLFGYTLAVIAGFLFTAGRNWTGQPTPTGGALLAFALLWVAGRLLMLTPYALAAAVVNAAFPVAVAIALAIPLWKSRNQRNYFFVPLLLLLGAAVLALHLSWLGVLAWPERASLLAGLDVVLFIIAVMGGRVIPMFTNNGIPGTQASRHPLIEKLALGSVLLLLAADVLAAPAARDRGHRPGTAALAHSRPALSLATVANLAHAVGVGAACGLRLDRRLPRAARPGGARPGRRAARAARTDHRHHRRHDSRHDDAHRARPYRPPARRRRLRGRRATCWFSAPR
jgi:hypothetical protein